MRNRAKRLKNNSSVSVTVKRAPNDNNNGEDVPQKDGEMLGLRKCCVKLKRVRLGEEPTKVVGRGVEVRLARVKEVSSVSPVTSGKQRDTQAESGSQPRRLSLRRKSTACEGDSRILQSATPKSLAPENVSPPKSPPVLQVFNPDADKSASIWKRSSLRSLSLKRKSAVDVNSSSVEAPVSPPSTEKPSEKKPAELSRSALSLSLRRKSVGEFDSSSVQKSVVEDPVPPPVTEKPSEKKTAVLSKFASFLSLRRKSVAEGDPSSVQKAAVEAPVPPPATEKTLTELGRSASSSRLRSSAKANTPQTIPTKRPRQAAKATSSPSVAPKQALAGKNCAVKVIRVANKPLAPGRFGDSSSVQKSMVEASVPRPATEKLSDKESEELSRSTASLSPRRQSVAEGHTSSVQKSSVEDPVSPPSTEKPSEKKSAVLSKFASFLSLRRKSVAEGDSSTIQKAAAEAPVSPPATEKTLTELGRSASSSRARRSAKVNPPETIPTKRPRQAAKATSSPSVAPKQALAGKNCAVKVIRVANKPLATGRSKFASRQKATTSEPPRNSPDMFSEADAANESDIYAFNSQSSTAEEHEDIAADIIEKLKRENKVTVSRHKRNIKPSRRGRKGPKMQPANWKKIMKNFSDVAAVPKADLKKMKPIAVNKAAAQIAPVPSTSKSIARGSSVPTASSSSGGFSRMAQNLLMKQTAALASPAPQHQKPRHIDKAKLLQFAMDFVGNSTIDHSTPNKVIARPPSMVRQSTATHTPPAGSASPWRVNDENVPRTFYFSRTTDDLPSYSSDVLPSSQPSVIATNRKSANKTTSPSRRAELSTVIPHVSPLKSFDENLLNISNIENISPVKPFGEKTNDKKSALIGVNPRRGLTERSPLKAINILNVVTLPNRVNSPQHAPNTMHRHSIRDKENAGVAGVSLSTSTKNQSKKSGKENGRNVSSESSLESNGALESSAHMSFGFSDDDNNLEDDVVEPLPKSMLPSKKRLSRRLHNLKRLLPPKPTRFSVGTIRSIFNSPKKQKDIREMLSSTRNASYMSINEDTLAGTSRVVADSDSSAGEMSAVEDNESNMEQDVHLFDDPEEPQTSFDVSVKIRTYERPKRKVKRVKNFLLFTSESEDDEEEKRAAKPKRTRPTKHDKELKKFAKEFNSMCEDVDKYELVVERSK